ncbi:lipid-binding protein [Saccharicrinis fermentans]|uniref:Lipid-binding putative hydrolase n=1 Tax=Saccharicrinis fermentans DSM 9555 = JCM 21142 TaxID=869213 RepID=W7YC92_9BACT|nr:lipid-binding protein [Saccharicrinis fermentans]GAF05068.1 lipid-binding putative hydrolase [Saccharicrinis fermentans DSM 9555 = JCM 21142]
MKNIYIYILFLVSSFLVVSCDKEDIGGTATESMAGEWYVTAVAIDADGEVVYEDEDLYNLGSFHLDTYNTADNVSNEMWISDNGNFWDFKVKVDILDDEEMLFTVVDGQNVAYDSKVSILGVILPNQATTPSGMPADSISFFVEFDDDTNPATYGFDSYRVAGYRYTGLAGDE